MGLTSRIKGTEHQVTCPDHDPVGVGTSSQILGDVAAYLKLSRDELGKTLFG